MPARCPHPTAYRLSASEECRLRLAGVTARSDAASEGRRVARRTLATLGEELRSARLAAGLSQRVAGSAAAMSHAQLGRIERAELPNLTVEQLSRAAAAVGLRLVVRAYPDGDPVRDAAHGALLGRFRGLLPAGTSWQTEGPLPILGDRRAWDGLATLGGRRIAVEAETRLVDVQALERRLALKRRDGGLDVMLLVLADTRSNRRALAAHREALRHSFPADGRAVRAALGRGELPAASGLVVL